MREVYVAGVAMTRFAKQPERSLKDLTAEAVTGALKDAGRGIADVEACFVANAVAGGSVDMETVPENLPAGRSFLMDLYAGVATDYMSKTGATQADFARVVVKNQRNGMSNPAAQYGSELTVEEILAAREIVWPFTLPMCSPITDGAAAALLVSDRYLVEGQPRVAVVASALRSASADGETSVTTLASRAAYEMAGMGPESLHCVEVHDAAASAEPMIYEQLGLAPAGDGPALIRSGETEMGGRVPVNTSGGLLARGHPIGATGLGQVVEVVLQLQGDADQRQVPGARVGLTQNAGGFYGCDNVVSVVRIYERRG